MSPTPHYLPGTNQTRLAAGYVLGACLVGPKSLREMRSAIHYTFKPIISLRIYMDVPYRHNLIETLDENQ